MKNLFLAILTALFFLCLSCGKNNLQDIASAPVNQTVHNDYYTVNVIYEDRTFMGKTLYIKDITIVFKPMPGAFDLARLDSKLLKTLESEAAHVAEGAPDPKAVLSKKHEYTLVTSLFDRTTKDSTQEVILLKFISNDLLAEDPKALRNHQFLVSREPGDLWQIDYDVQTGEFSRFRY